MIRLPRTALVLWVLLLLTASETRAQERVDRFPQEAASAPNAPAAIDDPRPSLAMHLLGGAILGGIGGLCVGAAFDGNQDPPAGADSFWNYESRHYYKINGTIVGAAAGAGLGALVYWIRTL